MEWTKEEKIELLTKEFRDNGHKFMKPYSDNNNKVVCNECLEAPFLIIRAAWFSSDTIKIGSKHSTKWLRDRNKYEIWLMEILIPFLDSWDEKYVGFTSPTDYQSINIWAKDENGVWIFKSQKTLGTILKYKENWV